MLSRKFKHLAMFSVPLLAAATIATAAQITPGSDGTATLQFNPTCGVVVTASALNFNGAPNSSGNTPCAGGTTTNGPIIVDQSGNTGLFAAFNNLPAVNEATGTITNINSTNAPVGQSVGTPPNSGVVFLVLPTNPVAVNGIQPNSITFVLTEVLPGIDGPGQCAASPAPGQLCTPPNPPNGSALNLQNLASGFSANLEVVGYAYVGSASTGYSPFIGTLSTSTPTGNFQQALAAIAANNGTGYYAAGSGVGGNSVQGTFTVTFVPEPATASMMLLGGLLVAGGAVRRRRAQKA
jgi:hypothetical protein